MNLQRRQLSCSQRILISWERTPVNVPCKALLPPWVQHKRHLIHIHIRMCTTCRIGNVPEAYCCSLMHPSCETSEQSQCMHLMCPLCSTAIHHVVPSNWTLHALHTYTSTKQLEGRGRYVYNDRYRHGWLASSGPPGCCILCTWKTRIASTNKRSSDMLQSKSG